MTGFATPSFYRCRPSLSLSPDRCDETSGLIAVTVGTSAAARVVLRVEGGTDTPETQLAGAAATVATAAATVANVAVSSDAVFRVPKGLWCYRVDRHRVVLGGALTDGGSAFEWLRSTLALSPGEDMDAVMREVEGMPPNSHALVVSYEVRGAWLVYSMMCGHFHGGLIDVFAHGDVLLVPVAQQSKPPISGHPHGLCVVVRERACSRRSVLHLLYPPSSRACILFDEHVGFRESKGWRTTGPS